MTLVFKCSASVDVFLSVRVKLHWLKILLKLLSFTGNGFPFHTFRSVFLSYLLLLPSFFFYLEMVVSVTRGTNRESALCW